MSNRPRRAVLIEAVQLAGTDLKLNADQIVMATLATNLPPSDGDQFYVRPPFGIWNDGIRRNLDDSILVSEENLAFFN